MPLSDVTNTTGTVVPAKLRPIRHHHASNATTTATKLTDMFATTKDAESDDFFTSCAKDEAVHANNSEGTTPHPPARDSVSAFSLSLFERVRFRARARAAFVLEMSL